MRLLGFALLSLASANAWELFVPDRQYRYCDPAIAECPKPNVIALLPEPRDRAPGEKQVRLPEIESGEGFKLGFIEFRDSGQHWDSVQLEAVKVMIEKARREKQPEGGPIHLIIFVHGWANNANKAPEGKAKDVERFKNYLKYYAESLRRDEWPVVGVYFGWHGRSLNLEHGLHFPSFWTRSAAAHRVGQQGTMYKDFRCLVDLANYNIAGGVKPQLGCAAFSPILQAEREALGGPAPPPAKRSRVIVMGHSFGSRVLEAALIGQDPNAGVVAGVCKSLIQGKSERPPVDLVLFENAATSARLIRRQFTNCQPCGRGDIGCKDFTTAPPRTYTDAVMVRPWAFEKRYCEADRTAPQCQPSSLLVSISGKFDLKTRLLLPLISGHVPAAFLPWLETHRLRRVEGDHPDADPDKNEVLVFDVCDEQLPNGECKDDRTVSYLMERKRINRVSPVNPVWSMAVPKKVISGHGDVWNHGYLNLAQNLLAARQKQQAAAPPGEASPLPLPPPAAQPPAAPAAPGFKGQPAGSARVRILKK